MKWIDQDFYKNQYGGIDIPDDQLISIANAAERIVDQLTRFRLSQADFTSYPEFVQLQVKMAVCAQVEYFYESGSYTEAGMTSVQSASIGGFTYDRGGSTSSTGGTNTGESDLYSKIAIKYLSSTGLMYGGLAVRG